jgi:hypothetical protein
MSNRRFIEISSSNRNRNQYPSPAQFEVPFAPSRTLNQIQTVKSVYYTNNDPTQNTNTVYTQSMDVADPVTNGIIEYQWYGTNQLVDVGTIVSFTTVGTTYTLTVSGINTSTNYTGYYIVLNNIQIPLIAVSTGGTLTFIYAGSLVVSKDLVFEIITHTNVYDSSALQPFTSNTSTTTNFYVNVSSLISPYKTVYNYYVGYLLVVNGSPAGIIVSYNPSNGLINVNIPLLSSPPTTGQPITIVDPSNGTSVNNTTDWAGYTEPALTIVLPAIDTTGRTILSYDQAYNGFYIVDETQSSSTNNIVSSMIVSYNFLTNTASIATPLSGWNKNNAYSIRRALPNQIWSIALPITQTFIQVPNQPQLSLSSNCIFLPVGANTTDNYYAGQYIYVYPQEVVNNQVSGLTNIKGTSYYINSYVGGNYRACFVSPTASPNVTAPTKYYPSYTNQLPNYPVPGTVINIVSFLNDNYTPLIYNGSVVSQNETVAYEISLVNLTLPNITLVTGSRPAYYPYLYVELSNVTASSGSSKNVIYSNNPNSTRALFLVPITDITDPLRSPFIKLDAGSMVQTVKFKPNDCLRFSVFLPNGELYQTVMSDYFSPSGPNPLVQIDSLFGIRRLTGV